MNGSQGEGVEGVNQPPREYVHIHMTVHDDKVNEREKGGGGSGGGDAVHEPVECEVNDRVTEILDQSE
jgi:hypothetical protein